MGMVPPGDTSPAVVLRKGRCANVTDPFDVSLEDGDLLAEVELTTNLIIAATESERHLTTDEIDKILGVAPDQRPPSV